MPTETLLHHRVSRVVRGDVFVLHVMDLAMLASSMAQLANKAHGQSTQGAKRVAAMFIDDCIQVYKDDPNNPAVEALLTAMWPGRSKYSDSKPKGR